MTLANCVSPSERITWAATTSVIAHVPGATIMGPVDNGDGAEGREAAACLCLSTVVFGVSQLERGTWSHRRRNKGTGIN